MIIFERANISFFNIANKQGRILIINYWHYHPTKLSS